MNWREREGLFCWGSALAIVPALAFLPAFVLLVFHPTIRHATPWAMLLFSVLAFTEFLGLFKLVQACVQRPFSPLTILSFGAMLVVLVIASYTEVLLAALAERM